MNILYVHGFGSSYDPDSDKVQELTKLGTVYGVNLDYTMPNAAAFDIVRNRMMNMPFIDLIVGTSMGGLTAAIVGAEMGIPYVAINPCVEPSEQLKKYEGSNTDYNGRDYVFTEKAIADYGFYRLGDVNGFGLILLDMDDEVCDSVETFKLMAPKATVVTFPGGSHRFTHMTESLELIEAHVNQASVSYGT